MAAFMNINFGAMEKVPKRPRSTIRLGGIGDGRGRRPSLMIGGYYVKPATRVVTYPVYGQRAATERPDRVGKNEDNSLGGNCRVSWTLSSLCQGPDP